MAATIITHDTIPPGDAPDAIVLSPHAALVLVDDGSPVLLDMNGDFYGISDIGVAMLTLSLERGQRAAAEEIAARYGVDTGRVAADLDALLAGLAARGVIRRRHGQGRRAPRTGAAGLLAGLLGMTFRITRRPRARAAAALALSRLSFALFGWNATVDAWRTRFPAPQAGAPLGTVDPRIDQDVRDLAARNWMGVDCKERALSCFAMARAAGLPAQLNIGIALFPLGGHCWCTSGETVLGDGQDRAQPYIPVFRFC